MALVLLSESQYSDYNIFALIGCNDPQLIMGEIKVFKKTIQDIHDVAYVHTKGCASYQRQEVWTAASEKEQQMIQEWLGSKFDVCDDKGPMFLAFLKKRGVQFEHLKTIEINLDTTETIEQQL